jgi:tetratricopeptide (TPR) repeat protein
MRLDPAEPRYPRMLYEAMLQVGDNDGALKALTAYRQTTTEAANDQLAMVQFLDLSAKQLETADARMEFYKKFIGTGTVPEPVRSHVALRAAQLARERGQAAEEDALLGQALQLNPLNLDALRAKLERVVDDPAAAPVDRVRILLAMLKSNPLQPAVPSRIAREFADAGLPEESLKQYVLAANLAGALGTALGRDFAMGYATELYLIGQPQLLANAEMIVEQLLKQDVGDVEALLLRWLCERAGGKKEAAAKTQQQVVNAALNRVIVLRQKLGVATATTRPVDEATAPIIPDLSADVATLKDEKFADLRRPYELMVTDLAWYLTYVANQPGEAQKLMPTLKGLLGDKSPTVARIEGWMFYNQGQFDQAGVKFRAVADDDVMAKAGTLLLWAKNPAEKAPAADAGRKLLQDNATDLLAVLLVDAMKDLGVKVEPTADAPALKKELADFAVGEWMRILEDPKAFYQLHAQMEGGRVLFPFGEPMIARVTIKNVSTKYDITIGPEGVIKNDLWFDAQLRGLVQQMVSGAAYERLGQALVLKPGQQVSQTLRLDQGQLAQVLAGNPAPAMTFYGQVRTNPRGDGGVGPGGQLMPFASITERSGFALDANSLKAVANMVATGETGERLRGLELMSAQVEQLRPQQAANPQAKVLVDSFLEAVRRAGEDKTSPASATWGMFLTAFHDEPRRAEMVEKLTADPDPTRRVVGLLIAHALPPERQRELLKAVQADPDEIIKTYTGGMAEIAKFVTAKAPTTAPAPAPLLAPGPGSLPPTAPQGGPATDGPKR